jgi:hypothetical protein
MATLVSPVSRRRVRARLTSPFLGVAAVVALPALGGCPGQLEGTFPPEIDGTGGTTFASSGGANGSASGGTSGGATGGTSGGASGGASGTPCDAPNLVFKPACGGSSCHGTGSPFGVFTGDDPSALFIGQPATFVTCPDANIVNPSQPPSGALFDLIMGSGCAGIVMPQTAGNPNPAPPSDFVDCITSWVSSKLP